MRILLTAFFIVFLGLQSAFWWQTRAILPQMTIVPDVPGVATVKALSLGDDEALYRLLALNVQNAGDTFGRFTALYKYDFNRLYHWFKLLDALDSRANYVPTMATYYFSQTQHKPDVKYIVDYLLEHADGRIKEKWWWVVQAIYLANHKLENKDLALKAALMLKDERDIPVWAQQMPAFVHEQRGEFEDASAIIESIIGHEKDLKQGEINFMYYFLKDRINRLDEAKDALQKLQKRHVPQADDAKPNPELLDLKP